MAEPKVSPRYQFSSDFIRTYSESIRDSFPGDSIKGRLYTFGDQEIDQVGAAAKLLDRDWFSRRAVVSLWNPTVDHKGAHPPCTLILQFVVRDDHLHATTVLRSNDAWMAALPDMIALSSIQEEVARKLSIAVGAYTQLSISYHLYEPDILTAKAAFGL